MPERMYFFIVGYKDEARVMREFADNDPISHKRPSGTLFEMTAEVDFGDNVEWDRIHQELEAQALALGIKTLHNLHPPAEMVAVAKKGAKLRARANSQPT